MANLVVAAGTKHNGELAKSKLDPYVRIELGKSKHSTSPYSEGGSVVKFDATKHKTKFHLMYDPSHFSTGADPAITFNVLDDAPGPDKFIGMVTKGLQELMSDDALEEGKQHSSLSHFSPPPGARVLEIHDKAGLPTGTLWLLLCFVDDDGNERKEDPNFSKKQQLHIEIISAEDLKDPNVSATPTVSFGTMLKSLFLFFLYVFGGALMYCYIGLQYSEVTGSDGKPLLDAEGNTAMKCEKDILYRDAVYYVITTLTTIGYGDFYPCNTSGRIITFFFILFAISLITKLISDVAEFFAARSEGGAVNVLDQNDDDDVSEEEWGLIYSIVVYLVMLLIGAFFIMGDQDLPNAACVTFVEGKCKERLKMNFADGMYWAMVTSSTVGYGDICAGTDEGKFFMYFYMLASILITAKTIGSVVSALTAAKEKAAREAALSNAVGSKHDLIQIKDTSKNFSSKALHLHNPGMTKEEQRLQVTKLEYVVHFAIKFGYCSEEHVEEILSAFAKIDTDGSGTLEAEDFLAVAKASMSH